MQILFQYSEAVSASEYVHIEMLGTGEATGIFIWMDLVIPAHFSLVPIVLENKGQLITGGEVFSYLISSIISPLGSTSLIFCLRVSLFLPQSSFHVFGCVCLLF